MKTIIEIGRDGTGLRMAGVRIKDGERFMVGGYLSDNANADDAEAGFHRIHEALNKRLGYES